MELGDLRADYEHAGLIETEMLGDPVDQFKEWLQQVIDHPLGDWFEPTAMTLATATPDGMPSARIVLLKDIDAKGRMVFFTSYSSQKGDDLASNPRAALCFYWGQFGRQVRIEGTIEKTTRAISEAYFSSRPRASQLGAVASEQSRLITGRDLLEQSLADAEMKYAGGAVPLPEDWGGYALTPMKFEFWQGRRNRLHDRIVYRRDGDAWGIERLGP
jgi:pyridoxamine 5'-phosphate oxidase